MECYFDNAATTCVMPDVAKLVSEVMTTEYGNPSSMHTKGVMAERRIKEATDRIAKTMKCKSKHIVYTSGGTESNNTAILGVANALQREGKHVITTCFEHPSVSEPCIYLESLGYDVTYLPVDRYGVVSKEVLRDALREDTILVSIMMVNNEIGALQDIAGLSSVIRTYANDTKKGRIVFHTDAVQAYGKMRIRPLDLGVDLVSVSAHKIHGPKGVGFLYIGDGVRLKTYMHGGGQQGGRRSGTENVSGIAGLGLAAEYMDRTLKERSKHLHELKSYMIERLGDIDDVTIHGIDKTSQAHSASHILSVSFKDVRSEVLLHALEDKEIYVSSGSACSSNHPGISSTLKAIGAGDSELESTIRFSFSEYSTKEQIDYTISVLSEEVPLLRRFVRR